MTHRPLPRPMPLRPRQTSAFSAGAALAPEAVHKGWRVLGHAPGQLEKAQRAHATGSLPQAGVRGAFDERLWRLNTRKTPVHTRPYALESSAQQCADLARKAGWMDVEILALVKP